MVSKKTVAKKATCAPVKANAETKPKPKAAEKKEAEAASNRRAIAYRQRAKWDLESIAIYIGQVQEAPKAAKQLVEAITNAISNLSEMPELGRPINDYRLEFKHYRSWLVESYRIFYSYDDETITIWRIVHTSQDFDDCQLIEF